MWIKITLRKAGFIRQPSTKQHNSRTKLRIAKKKKHSVFFEMVYGHRQRSKKIIFFVKKIFFLLKCNKCSTRSLNSILPLS